MLSGRALNEKGFSKKNPFSYSKDMKASRRTLYNLWLIRRRKSVLVGTEKVIDY
jgi:hypothetical protein